MGSHRLMEVLNDLTKNNKQWNDKYLFFSLCLSRKRFVVKFCVVITIHLFIIVWRLLLLSTYANIVRFVVFLYLCRQIKPTFSRWRPKIQDGRPFLSRKCKLLIEIVTYLYTTKNKS